MDDSISSIDTPFEFPTYILGAKEYGKIINEINTNYRLYAREELCSHSTVGNDGKYYVYLFENHGFGNYNIYGKFEI